MLIKNYINGVWIDSKSDKNMDIENPSNGNILGQVPLSTAKELDNAVEAANEAFKFWKNTPISRRVQPLYKLVSLLRENEEEISTILSKEMGKSLPDAKAEMKRVFENCESACGMPILQQGDKLIGASFGIDGEVLQLPVGVFGMIAPFNFPAMVPFWFIPYAIATGNTFILKPSELVPLTMQKMAEYIDQSGFPKGVFNMVHGDKVVGEAMINNPKVKGVSVVGSTKTCKIVASNCAANGKRYQAMGGAKNHLIAMPDAKIDKVIQNMITSCFGCAGQRCMAASVIVAVGNHMYKEITTKFVEEAKKIIVADPLDPKVKDESMVMGPVITSKAKEFILSMIAKGVEEGATLALDGRDIVVEGGENGNFIGATVFTDVKPGMEIHKTEIFGPVVCIMKVDNLDEAISIINNHQYGNGASIYTQNGFYVRKFKMEAQAGMIGVNIGIPAPVASLPFGGMKDSLFSDIKAQGRSTIKFFTDEKIVTERYWEEN